MFRNETTSSDFWMPYGTAGTALLASVLFLIVLITILGNTLVAAAVFSVRKLRHPPNFLLVSLALADFFLGLLVLPFSSLYLLIGTWQLGWVMCLFWTSADVFLCTASILNLCAVSVDRYCAITRPLTYGAHRTAKRILCYILVVWILAFLISVVPAFIITNKSATIIDGKCQVNQNMAYQIYATLGAFYIPVAIMLLLNYKIFKAANKLAEKDRRSSSLNTPKLTKKASRQSLNLQNITVTNNSTGNISRTHRNSGTPSSSGEVNPEARNLLKRIAARASVFWPDLTNGKASTVLMRDSRAAKTLTIIMGAFIVCWLPFFVIALIKPICGSRCKVPDWLDHTVLWLGYVNSTINPGLYAMFNRDFRVPFREMLCCRCRHLQTVLRSETFQEIYGYDSRNVVLSPDTTNTPINQAPGSNSFINYNPSTGLDTPTDSLSLSKTVVKSLSITGV